MMSFAPLFLAFAAPVLAAPPAPPAPPPPMIQSPQVVATARLPDRTVELLSGGGRMWLRSSFERSRPALIELAATDQLLLVLADQRLSALWPAILDWAGPDLVRHRDRRLERARVSARIGLPMAVASSENERQADLLVRAQLQYSNALVEAGRFKEADRFLRGVIATAASTKSNQGYDEVQLRLKLAQVHHKRGGTATALAIIEEGERDPRLLPDYRLNYEVNRAAMLAEMGRHSDALRLIDRVAGAFEEVDAENVDPLEGSQQEFRWIRACALHGLGRKQEAAEAMAPLLSYTASNRNRIYRSFLCMRDPDGLAALLAAELERGDLPVAAALVLQPGAPAAAFRAETLRAAAAHPRVLAAARGKVRVLPPELQPAVRHWRED